MNRLELVEQIMDCSSCELSQSAVPVVFRGETPARIAVLGLKPDVSDGQAFEGERGQRLASLLPDLPTFWMNVASCPGAVKAKHVAACSANCDAQLELASPEFVLIVGDEVTLGKVKPKHLQGFTFRMDGKTFFPVADPMTGDAAILEQLERFKALVDQGDWMDFCGDLCAACGQLASHWDGDSGLPWCDRHAPAVKPPAVKQERPPDPARVRAGLEKAPTPKSCSLCGVRASRWIAPYWQRDRPVCPECARDSANGYDKTGWPEEPWAVEC